MYRQLLNLPAIARPPGFVFVAIAIIGATLHFRDVTSHVHKRSAEPEAADPHSDELKRCHVLAGRSKDDAACEAAWAESRRRFFIYQATSRAAAAPEVMSKSSAR